MQVDISGISFDLDYALDHSMITDPIALELASQLANEEKRADEALERSDNLESDLQCLCESIASVREDLEADTEEGHSPLDFQACDLTELKKRYEQACIVLAELEE